MFPPAAEADAWPPARLARLAAAVGSGRTEDVEAILSSPVTAAAASEEGGANTGGGEAAREVGVLRRFVEKHATNASTEGEMGALADGEGEVETEMAAGTGIESTMEREVREKEEVLKKMWSRLENVVVGPDRQQVQVDEESEVGEGHPRQSDDVDEAEGGMEASPEAESQVSAAGAVLDGDQPSPRQIDDALEEVEGGMEASPEAEPQVSATDAVSDQPPPRQIDDVDEAEQVETLPQR